jgi:hypothetical protein
MTEAAEWPLYICSNVDGAAETEKHIKSERSARSDK